MRNEIMKTKRTPGLRAALLLGLLGLAVGALAASDFYVDVNNGNDLNTGLSTATPWQTLKKANETAVAGDRIYIREGTYSQPDGNNSLIHPKYSGAAGAYITYRNYGSETVVLTGCYQPIYLTTNYIKVEGLTIDGGSQDSSAIDIFALIQSSRNIIQNCTMRYVRRNSDWMKGIYIASTGSYNQIINNTIQYVGQNAQPAGNNIGDGIWVDGNHTLVELNDVSYCGHNGLLLRGQYNIARRNILHGEIGRSAEMHSPGSSNAHLVMDSNVIRNAGGFTPGPCPSYGMQADSPYGIVRRNEFYNNHGHGMEIWGLAADGSPKHSRIYHNVSVKNGLAADVTSYVGYGLELNQISEPAAGDFKDVVMKNNIIYKNKNVGVYYKPQTDPNDHIEANNHMDTNGSPGFAGEGAFNLRLSSSSPCVDAGAFLTTTAQAGAGTTIPLVDAGYFIDGFGIVEGDLIQLRGRTDKARITAIDYASNTVVVDRALTWSAGQGVSLAFSGSAPDIGAYEYETTGTEPLTATVGATPVTGQAPLAVSFTGLSAGGTAPYSYSWNLGDGGTAASQDVSHTYASNGDYTATLTVTDSTGATATGTQLISATILPVTLSGGIIATPASGQAPLPVQFAAVASGGAAPYTCTWSFGDGQTAVGVTASHTYTAGGNYGVVVVISDGQGNVTQAAQTISVTAPASAYPVSVYASRTSGRAPIGITFSARVSGAASPYGYAWDFGDGTTSALSAPAHTFSTPGTYSVRVTVTDSLGVKGTAAIAITAKDRPKPDLRFWPSNLSLSTKTAPTNSPTVPTSSVKKRIIKIVKTGTGTAPDWTIACAESWVAFSRTSGTGSGSVQAIIDASNLAPGIYSTTINVSSPEAQHPFQMIPVTLVVAAPIS
jgi:PKD repeat protein